MAILFFFCLIFSILTIRMLIAEVVFKETIPNWIHWGIYIPTCILWSMFFYLH
jgi:hypothetical protein